MPGPRLLWPLQRQAKYPSIDADVVHTTVESADAKADGHYAATGRLVRRVCVIEAVPDQGGKS